MIVSVFSVFLASYRVTHLQRKITLNVCALLSLKETELQPQISSIAALPYHTAVQVVVTQVKRALHC